jgi:hypothetical protein
MGHSFDNTFVTSSRRDVNNGTTCPPAAVITACARSMLPTRFVKPPRNGASPCSAASKPADPEDLPGTFQFWGGSWVREMLLMQ